MYEFIRIVTSEISEPEWWGIFFDEYNELSALSKKAAENKTLDLAIQINYLTTRKAIVQSIVERLWVRRNDEAIELLQDMGFAFSFEDLRHDLERVILMLKGDEIELNRAIAEYKELEASISNGTATAMDWYNILAMLGKHNACVLNARTLTVIEYLAFDAQFRQWVEINKPKETAA